MIYTIIKYIKSESVHLLVDEFGNKYKMDLFVDSTFPEVQTNEYYYSDDYTQHNALMKAMVGRKIEVGDYFVYNPTYIATNVKFCDLAEQRNKQLKNLI